MFKRILVPVDFTPKNRAVLDIAMGMAAREGTEIHMLHAIELVLGLKFEELKRFYAGRKKVAEAKISALARRFGRKGIRTRAVVLFGDPTKQIVSYIARAGIDLVVLNSHRLQPLRPGMGWGTVSYKVGLLADCPVLLVK